MQLSSLDRNKTYTYADYAKWDFENRVELIGGKIYELTPAPTPYHQELVSDINAPLKEFLRDKPCKVYFAPIDVYLAGNGKKDTVLQPDIIVVCDLAKMTKKGCTGAPDIVVEVLSPGNNTKEMKLKYEVYEQSGVKEYWVVSPQNMLFIVYVLIGGKFRQEPIKTIGDVVTSSVLPGFSLDIAALFKNAPADGDY